MRPRHKAAENPTFDGTATIAAASFNEAAA